MKPTGHTAVMSSRAAMAPGELDYFPTPPWAARAGGELIKRIDPAARSCWEPACGEGHMAWGLRDYFPSLLASDIFDYGATTLCDFLAPGDPAVEPVDWIVTNPPFASGEAFVRAALPRARRGVAMLLRSVFLESAGRYPLFTDPAMGFAVAAQFAERVPMVKGRWDPAASSATAYSWFLWVKREAVDTQWAVVPDALDLCRPQFHLGCIIPPGTKARLSKPEDLAHFCTADSGPLFSPPLPAEAGEVARAANVSSAGVTEGAQGQRSGPAPLPPSADAAGPPSPLRGAGEAIA